MTSDRFGLVDFMAMPRRWQSDDSAAPVAAQAFSFLCKDSRDREPVMGCLGCLQSNVLLIGRYAAWFAPKRS